MEEIRESLIRGTSAFSRVQAGSHKESEKRRKRRNGRKGRAGRSYDGTVSKTRGGSGDSYRVVNYLEIHSFYTVGKLLGNPTTMPDKLRIADYNT